MGLSADSPPLPIIKMYVAGIDVVERNHGLVISLFLFTVLAVTAVTMRLFTRLVLVRAVGVDDVFITIAALGTMGFLIAVMEREQQPST